MKLSLKKLLLAAMAASTLLSAAAYEVDPTSGNIKWKYYNGTPTGDSISSRSYFPGGEIPTGTMSGSAYYSSSFNTTAKPLTAPATLNELNSLISYTLQERRNINQSNIVLSSDDQTNIYVDPGKNVDVWVTFLNEGAGFENSVGFFTFDRSSVPTRNSNGTNTLTSEQIFFPRASTSYPLPAAGKTGTTVYLGNFNGGVNGLGIGYFVVSNGWSGTGRSTNPAVSGVKANQDKSWIYYSLKNLNPECVGKDPKTCNLNQHTILLNDKEVTGTDGTKFQRLVLGIEDYKRTETACDHDFNDVLLAVHVTSNGAVNNLASFPQLISAADPDTDGDGVKDSADDFPKDATKAYSRYYPGSNTWGTLAYEDLWPSIGDYDLNDVVVRYRSREILNASRQVKALEMDLRLDATGAGFNNGFAVALPGVLATNVASVTLTKDGVAVANAVQLANVQAEKNGVVFEIFKDAKALIQNDPGGALGGSAGCLEIGFRNTGSGCWIKPGPQFKLSVELKTALATFPTPPYDSFIFRDIIDKTTKAVIKASGIEVHLVGKQPTNRADLSQFGTLNDRSVLGTASTYKTSKGLPWALDIPVEWDYPQEKLDVVNVYPNIATWAASGGVNSKNWYELSPANASKTFRNGR